MTSSSPMKETTPVEPTSSTQASELPVEPAQPPVPEPGRLAKLMTSPAGAATIVGSAVLAAATLFGPIEAAIGAGAAYSAYRIFRNRVAARREAKNRGGA